MNKGLENGLDRALLIVFGFECWKSWKTHHQSKNGYIHQGNPTSTQE